MEAFTREILSPLFELKRMSLHFEIILVIFVFSYDT